MLKLQSRLRANHREVASKIIDGEAILIRLSDGTYYSMSGVGGAVWELIEEGESLASIIASVQSRSQAPGDQVETDIRRLAQDLLRERLIEVHEDGGTTRPREPGESGTLVYEPPELNIYQDMKDLLALDPPAPGAPVAPWREPGE